MQILKKKFNSDLLYSLGVVPTTSLLDALFKSCIYLPVSKELGVAEPNVEFYKRALEKIPFEADEVLYIRDSIKLDLKPALSLGIKTLIIDRVNFYPNLEKRISSLNEIKNYL